MKQNAERERIFAKVSFPVWFRVFYAIGGPMVLGSICVTLISFGRDGFSPLEIVKSGFLFSIVVLGFYVTRIFFSTVYANELGIQRHGLLGGQQAFSWNDVKTVTRGRFGFPHDAAYIVSSGGQKITIARSMSGYPELLHAIESRAPNLTPKQLPSDLWPSPSVRPWSQLFIFLMLFVVYIIIRKILGW